MSVGTAFSGDCGRDAPDAGPGTSIGPLAGDGLERSCAPAGDGIRTAPPCGGIERIEARFSGHAYDPHRHDTYAVGLTLAGVQSFTYRGAGRDSLAGQAIVLHPDEVHDGRSGDGSGFAYRMAYVEPGLIRAALDGLGAGPRLPFVPTPVTSDPRMVAAAARTLSAIDSRPEPLEADQMVLVLAEGLAAVADDPVRPVRSRVDGPAMDRVRDYLDAGRAGPVTSERLEAIGGMDRWQLARQFRLRFGTSPYRYLVMRRLDAARAAILGGAGLAEAAIMAGFADQSHMTRQFRGAYGLSPGRWRDLLLR